MGNENKEQELLERIANLTQENSQMLRKLYRAMVWGRIMRILYILLILGAMFGTYYYVQPYIGDLLNVYTGAQDVLSTFKGATQQMPR